MTGWILFGITAVVAVAALAALKRKSDADLRQLEDASRTSLQQLETESERRVARLEREADSRRGEARDALAHDLFAAVDSLQSAIRAAQDPDTVRGIELVLDDVYSAFARHGIEPIDPAVGDPFDPNQHEAIDVAEDVEVGPGQVARCHRTGFHSGSRVLRPAMVSVGAKRDVATPSEEPEPAVAEASSVPS